MQGGTLFSFENVTLQILELKSGGDSSNLPFIAIQGSKLHLMNVAILYKSQLSTGGSSVIYSLDYISDILSQIAFTSVSFINTNSSNDIATLLNVNKNNVFFDNFSFFDMTKSYTCKSGFMQITNSNFTMINSAIR